MKMWRRILRPMLLVILSSSLLGQSVFAQFSSSTAARTTTGATSGAGGGSTSGFGTGATGAGGAGAGGAGATSGGMFGNTQGGTNVFGQGLNAQSRQVNAQSQLGINPSQFLGQGNNQQNFLGRNQRTQTQTNRTLDSIRLEIERRPSVKGEFTLIIGRASATAPAESDPDLASEVALLVAAGALRMDAIKAVAKRHGLSKADVYEAVEEAKD